jgi:hypothetical protein
LCKNNGLRDKEESGFVGVLYFEKWKWEIGKFVQRDNFFIPSI